MAKEQAPPAGPDLTRGVAIRDFNGMTLLGYVDDQDVLLVRSDSEIFAINARWIHYHAPLADGIVVGDSIPVPGITPVSICVAGRRPRQRSMPHSLAGRT